MGNKNILKASVYISSISTQFRKKDMIDTYNKIQDILIKLKQNTTVILGGDFNATMNPAIDRIKCTNIPYSTTKPESTLLKRLTDYNGSVRLVDLWRYLHPNEINFTHTVGATASAVSKSRIDMFLTSRDLIIKPVNTQILPTKISTNLHH
jgi:exonuclease III